VGDTSNNTLNDEFLNWGSQTEDGWSLHAEGFHGDCSPQYLWFAKQTSTRRSYFRKGKQPGDSKVKGAQPLKLEFPTKGEGDQ